MKINTVNKKQHTRKTQFHPNLLSICIFQNINIVQKQKLLSIHTGIDVKLERTCTYIRITLIKYISIKYS